MLNLAIVGVGLVGSELIRQIAALPAKHASKFRIILISSSRHTLLNPPKDWKAALASAPAIDILSHLSKNKLDGQTVLVDNTSSDAVASTYPSYLKAGISIVTPNKKGFSGPLKLWEEIIVGAEEGKARFLNESTVGAGLPIIAPLKEMIATGDRITKIEGVFSGTLSYIFNEYSPIATGTGDASPKPTFSEIVKKAKENGYTEPNPADDLSGSDVSRKLTILSRLLSKLASRLQNGFTDVDTQSLVPEALQGQDLAGDDFVTALTKFDDHYGKLRDDASSQGGSVLRYVGSIDVESKKIKASLNTYLPTHPFAASLKGSDNIILIHTARYKDRPLIVQGAGAGSEVTAMGVLGDLFKLAGGP